MYIVFDAGGTKTRVASSENGISCSEPVVFPSKQSFEEEIIEIKKVADQLRGDVKVRGIAGGIAGPFNEERTQLMNSSNLLEWVGVPIKDKIEQAFKAPVYLENDTAMVGLGEATHGSGKDYGIVAYITVSTGVGGVRIIDRKIDRAKFGFEPGHHIIDMNNGKELEECISGRAIEERTGKKPYNITDEKVWDEEARLLAIGLNNVAVFWSPEVIILGGSMIVGKPGISTDLTKEKLKEIHHIFPEIPDIKEAELGDFGGLYGSLFYLREKIG